VSSSRLPVPVAAARERTIELLSASFAQDQLSIDELDQRLERAYAAASLAELDALTADLPDSRRAAASLPAHVVGAPPDVQAPRRIVAILSESKRGGLWAVPEELDVSAVMSNLTLDLRSALLGPGVTDIRVNAIMAQLHIFLPPGVRVLDEVRPFMASVADDSYSDLTADPSVPVIRLSGRAIMAEVRVKTRPRLVRE
jgi:hypothetical protein